MTTPTVRFRCAAPSASLAAVAALFLAFSQGLAQLTPPAKVAQMAGVLAPATAVIGAGIAAPAKRPAMVKVVGVLTDASTGEALVGGQVGVVGMPLGNVSDDSGGYFINNVPAGRVTFKVEYLGYETLVEEHEVRAGSPNTLDFALEPTPIEGAEVVVEEQSTTDLSDYVERTPPPTLQRSAPREAEIERSDTTLMEDWHRSWRNFQPLYSIEYPMIGERVYFQQPSAPTAPARLARPQAAPEKEGAPSADKQRSRGGTAGSSADEKRPASRRSPGSGGASGQLAEQPAAAGHGASGASRSRSTP
jgi:hypothetical protein